MTADDIYLDHHDYIDIWRGTILSNDVIIQ